MTSRTVYDVLALAARNYGHATALHQPLGKGKYKTYTWVEYRDAAQEIALGLRAIGIRKGDIVALHSETRAEFYLADHGILTGGAIAAALYTSYPIHELVKNLRASDAKAVFAEDPKSMRSLLQAAGDVPFNMQWILLDGQAEGALTLDQLRARGRELLAADSEAFARLHAAVKPDDHAILYLTSGATGEPKMGFVTHAALIANVDMGPVALPLGPGDATIAFLPSAHIAQRVVLEFLPIGMGAPVWFSESLARLPNELKTIRPTFLLAPPRVWERIFASISTEIKKRPAYARKLFYWAVGLGAEAARLRAEGKSLPGWMRASLKVANRLVFSKIRQRLGGRLRIAASGAAPLGKELAGFYQAIGMPLVEGYGLTEGGVTCLNPLASPRPGSIGRALPGVKLRLGDDGELLIQSPTLFSGYYKDPEATAAVLRDGWLYTGDIAEIDADGYVYITGRKKELIVSTNGKKIYPARIEGLFKTEPLINQILLIGDRLPFVTALVTVNTANAETLKGMEAFHGREAHEIAVAPPVATEIQNAVSRVNKQLAPFEQIRKFRVLERDFTIERGELTPTMKVRRSKVLENHRDTVNELYMGKEEMQ